MWEGKNNMNKIIKFTLSYRVSKLNAHVANKISLGALRVSVVYPGNSWSLKKSGKYQSRQRNQCNNTFYETQVCHLVQKQHRPHVSPLPFKDAGNHGFPTAVDNLRSTHACLSQYSVNRY